MNENLYDVLGVSAESTGADIKQAYRNQSKKHHPDAGGDPATFKLIVLAYETLSDDEKRKKYDTDGTTDDTSTEMKAAIQHVKTTFLKVIQAMSEHDGVPALMRGMPNVGIVQIVADAVKKHIGEISAEIRSIDKAIKDVERQAKRCKQKNKIKIKTGDLYASTINAVLESAKNNKAQAEATLSMLKLAKQIINDYEDVEVEQDITIGWLSN